MIYTFTCVRRICMHWRWCVLRHHLSSMSFFLRLLVRACLKAWGQRWAKGNHSWHFFRNLRALNIAISLCIFHEYMNIHEPHGSFKEHLPRSWIKSWTLQVEYQPVDFKKINRTKNFLSFLLESQVPLIHNLVGISPMIAGYWSWLTIVAILTCYLLTSPSPSIALDAPPPPCLISLELLQQVLRPRDFQRGDPTWGPPVRSCSMLLLYLPWPVDTGRYW